MGDVGRRHAVPSCGRSTLYKRQEDSDLMMGTVCGEERQGRVNTNHQGARTRSELRKENRVLTSPYGM